MPGRRKRTPGLLKASKKRRENEQEGNGKDEADDEEDSSEENDEDLPYMEYRHLGKSGLKLSVLSLGAWVNFGEKINEETVFECLRVAMDSGVNYFDVAEIYGNGKAELVLGRALKRLQCKRSDLVISTKLIKCGDGPNDQGLSRKHIIEGLDASLERLQLTYVDLVYCHRPDLITPIEETVRAMTHVINQGKAFYWGTSEWSSQQIMEAYSIARQYNLIPPTMEQPEYNMFRREKVEKEFLNLYKSIGLGVAAWSPLAYGFLTGKYNSIIPEGSRFAMEKFKDYARKLLNSDEGKIKIAKIQKMMIIAECLDCTMAQLAIAWCIKNPNVSTVITGASSPDQVLENIKAVKLTPKLTDSIMKQIDDILDNKLPPDIPPIWARYNPVPTLS